MLHVVDSRLVESKEVRNNLCLNFLLDSNKCPFGLILCVFCFYLHHKHCEILFSVTLLLLSFLLTHVIRTSGTWIPLSLPGWNPGSPQRALSLLQLFEGTVILHSPNITGISGMDAITLEAHCLGRSLILCYYEKKPSSFEEARGNRL